MVRKSIYSTWMRYLDEGEGSWSDYMVEAFLTYWLSWYILPSQLEDGLNQYMFLPIHQVVKGSEFTLGTLYLRLDQCVHNFTRSVGHYDVMIHTYLRFLQMFLWKSLLFLGRKARGFS